MLLVDMRYLTFYFMSRIKHLKFDICMIEWSNNASIMDDLIGLTTINKIDLDIILQLKFRFNLILQN